ncbi:MAG: hypothetical protein GC179_09785 [Anaerolineaceae bacterium]|nr:hypothetical protein [Anaerolineaceae bacterium]
MSAQNRFSARFWIPLFIVVAIIAAVLAFNTQTTHAATPQEVGIPPAGQNAIEIIGKIDQNGLAFNSYGYLTRINGVPDDQMFTDPANHSEATARFTYASTANLTARSVIETLFVLDAAGSTTIYYNDMPKGDFKDPNTFAAGTAIATANERWQTVINVQSPDTGIATGISEFTESSATPFTLNNTDYQFGHANLVLRSSFTGEGKRSDKILPKSVIIIAGNAVVAGG